jgi:hypothetical protein
VDYLRADFRSRPLRTVPPDAPQVSRYWAAESALTISAQKQSPLK